MKNTPKHSPLYLFLCAGVAGAAPALAQESAPASTDVPAIAPSALQWGDYNGDGKDDALAVTPAGTLQLLRSAGDGSFVNATAEAGLSAIENASFAIWKDYDADGHLDLFVGTSTGPCHLLQGRRSGFVDVTALTGITAVGRDYVATWLDYDKDGILDLHLLNASENTVYHGLESGGFEAVELPPVRPHVDAGGQVIAYVASGSAQGAEGGQPAAGGPSSNSNGTGSGAIAPAAQAAPGSAMGGRVPAGATDAVASSTGGGVANPPVPPAINILDCVQTLRDANGGPCLEASATPTLGMLFPISEDVYIDSTSGFVGLGTDTPTNKVHIVNGTAGLTANAASDLVIEGSGDASVNLLTRSDQEASVFFGNPTAGDRGGQIVFNPFNGTTPNGFQFRTGVSEAVGIAIDSSARVGVGTDAPARSLHVQNGSSGTVPSVNSSLVVESSSEASISLISPVGQEASVFMGNANSGPNAGAVVFNPFGGALPNGLVLRTDDTNRVAITEAGRVGINTLVPAADLHLVGSMRITSDDPGVLLENTGAGGRNYTVVARDGNLQLRDAFVGTPRLLIRPNGNIGIGTSNPTFRLEVNGSAGKPGGGSWSVSSDARLKKNVNDLEGSLETLLSLRGVTYEYKDPEGINELSGERTGFIAQEVEAVMPDWVEEINGYKRLTIRGFEALAVESLRELKNENEDLAAANKALAERVARLEGIEAELSEVRSLVAALREGR